MPNLSHLIWSNKCVGKYNLKESFDDDVDVDADADTDDDGDDNWDFWQMVVHRWMP